jgi:hypothetical protein
MTEEQKQALIEWLKPQIDELQNVSDEIPFGLDSDSAMHLNAMRIALSALTSQPDSAPCDWVYIRFTDISKSQRMKCQIAWSDWLNSVIYDEEGAPLLISNSAFQVIRAAGYQVEGE